MSETVNQEVIVDAPVEAKTFTQEEVDAVIGERLKRERAKYADYDALRAKAEKLDAIEEASKSELQKATERAAALQAELDSLRKADAVRSMRERVATDTGVPMSLITADNEEDAKKQAEEILEFARPAYPSVPDGGEVTKTGKMSTRQQFAEWAKEAFN